MMPRQNNKRKEVLLVTVCLWLVLAISTTTAFIIPTITSSTSSTTKLHSTAEQAPKSDVADSAAEAAQNKKKSGYVPKWKKKKTLADDMGGDMNYQDKGIKGSISVVFQQGDETKTTMAMPGQPLRDVATQAGQFIKYGCGKGECGTCEAMCNGKWIRPCTSVVPVPESEEEEIVIQVKDIANKAKSSGQFFSVKSFFMGFWNNVLGMVGFVKYRRNAKQNWEERQEYEELIRTLTLEKRHKRQLAWKLSKEGSGTDKNDDDLSGLSP